MEGTWDPGRLGPLSQQSSQEVVSRHLGFLLFGKKRNEAGIVWGVALLGGAHEQGRYLREQSPSVCEGQRGWRKAEASTHQPGF